MYQLLDEPTLAVEIKKSRFIATCVAVDSAEAAQEAIARLRAPAATHNCWAWRIGEQYRFNDDGEPGGSAGRPILAAIDGQQFDGVLAHVVRYFGGIKLGVGGLVRAYGNTVAECLRTAQKRERVVRVPLCFEVDFADTYAVYGLITQGILSRDSEEYTASGVRFAAHVDAGQKEAVTARIVDLTRARVRWVEEEHES